MAHTNPIISKVKLPGSELVYDIHDAQAIHQEELDQQLESLLNELSGVLIFKGTVPNAGALPSDANEGDVYLALDTDKEYVYANGEWQEFGASLVTDHTHTVTIPDQSIASSGTNSLAVTGAGTGTASLSATVSGSTKDQAIASTGSNTISVDGTYKSESITSTGNADLGVSASGTGEGEVTVPTVSKSATYIKGNKGTVATTEGDFLTGVTGNEAAVSRVVKAAAGKEIAVGATSISTFMTGASVASTTTATTETFAVNADGLLTITSVAGSVTSKVTPTTDTVRGALEKITVDDYSITPVQVVGSLTPATGKALLTATGEFVTGLAAGTSADGVHSGDKVTIGSKSEAVEVDVTVSGGATGSISVTGATKDQTITSSKSNNISVSGTYKAETVSSTGTASGAINTNVTGTASGTVNVTGTYKGSTYTSSHPQNV